MNRARRAAMDVLESRRLFAAANPVATTVAPQSYVAEDDLFDINVTLSVSGSTNGLTVPVFVYLSKDKVFGNADDITTFGSSVFLPQTGKKTVTQKVQVGIDSGYAAGDYYLVTVTDPFGVFGEAGKPTHVEFSNDKPVRIVTDKLTTDTITTTAGNDVVRIDENFSSVVVTVNGVSKWFDHFGDNINRLTFDLGTGNDKLFPFTTGNSLPLRVTGGGGKDTIIGSEANDELSGANGNDKVFGGKGQDYLIGGAGNDSLSGDDGNDTLSGAGGADRLVDVVGRNYFLGGAGNDVIIARDTINDFDNKFDTISGGAGSDRAQIDADDTLAGIEEQLA
jgi:Ca2+-binding RTX toxin-like protein